jgi:outer membrane protein assembly factor BamB
LTLPKVWLASVVLPPVGLLLWWLRPWPEGTVRKVLGFAGRAAISVVLIILTIVYAVKLNLVFVEASGAGIIPIFSFRDPKLNEDALEKHRAAQGATATPAAAARGTAPVAEPVKPSDAPATAAGATAPATAAAAVEPWGEFRGANRDGIYREGPILTAWPAEGLKPLWRQPIGGGYASFAVARGRAYTIEQRREKEVVAAYDAATGRELWTHAWDAHFQESMGGPGPRATPTWHAGRIYALGAAGEFRVLEAETGKKVWSKDILADAKTGNIMWGMANSPLIVDDKVIVTPGGRGASVVAYDKESGERVWGSLDDQAAYTSPAVVTLAGERQIIVVTATRVVGLGIAEGKLLWEYPWVTMYEINSAQPIVTDANHVFVSAGYDHGSILLKIEKGEDGFHVQRVWENKNLKNRFNSSVLYQGHLYGYDEGIFACIDARTGERKWKGGRYGYGQALLAGNHILVITESGELVLLKATPESHQEVARFPAMEGKTWNHPAIAGGILLVRNAREMAAFRVAP